MAKTSGGVRTYRQGTSTYQKRRAEVEAMRASGRYSSVELRDSGGYVAIEKSKMKHRPEELEAASILANKGYKVILKDETGLDIGIKTPDGYLFSVSFEQRTPTRDSKKTIMHALKHARNKNADIALLYSRGSSFSRKAVEEGIRTYESEAKYRFKKIIVVSSSGKIHRHRHNDI